MKKKIFFAFICILTIVVFLLPLSVVSAKNDKFIEVSGSYPIKLFLEPHTMEQKGNSDTWILSYQWSTSFSGDIEADGVIIGWWIMIKYDPMT